MNIETIEVDGDTLSTRKAVEVQSKNLETPVKALQVGKIRGSEDVSPLARGVAEIYRKANAVALENSREGWTGLADKLDLQAKSAQEDEVVVPFIEYEDTTELDFENACEIARLQANYGDFVVVPLMVPLVKAADDGDGRDSTPVSKIINNTKTFLQAVDQLEISKPMMGVIPPISAECTTVLFELYAEAGVRAFCIDFSRRSPMARSQLDNVTNPLMGRLVQYDLRQKSLVYAVNAKDSRRGKSDHRTPDSIYSFTLGIDIFGDNHIPPNWPEEVFEKIEKQNKNGEVELRLFDAESVSVVEVPVDELDSFLPSEAEIPVSRVQSRIAKNTDEKYRFANLINAELISLYLGTDGGMDAREIFIALSSADSAKESDLDRIRELSDEIN